jgi:hypothetical protein
MAIAAVGFSVRHHQSQTRGHYLPVASAIFGQQQMTKQQQAMQRIRPVSSPCSIATMQGARTVTAALRRTSRLAWRRYRTARRPRSSVMRIVDASALSGFARKTTESASDFASVVHNLIMGVRDGYRPELHYMRGPGPKWRTKHQPRQSADSEAVLSAGHHQLALFEVTQSCS